MEEELQVMRERNSAFFFPPPSRLHDFRKKKKGGKKKKKEKYRLQRLQLSEPAGAFFFSPSHRRFYNVPFASKVHILFSFFFCVFDAAAPFFFFLMFVCDVSASRSLACDADSKKKKV